MINPENIYNSLISIENIKVFPIDEALKKLGMLIDLCADLGRKEGSIHAIRLSEQLQNSHLSPEQFAILHYFNANAWADIRKFSICSNFNRVWDWQQSEIEHEIYHLRSALNSEGFKGLPKLRQCQILTNIANLLDHIGRFVEAIEYWNNALDIIPSFSMAQGNRGYGLFHYARVLYDIGQASVFLKYSHYDLKSALSGPLYDDAKKGFKEKITQIESAVSTEYLSAEFDMHSFSLGNSDQEIEYRKWCLKNNLFLNPLNDLGPYPIACSDILNAPSIVVNVGEGPYYFGYFNQIKQEYASARYLFYETIDSKEPHFSDKGVFLYNTLDYPSYCLSVEKVKAAFRIIYSLFDKIAYFANHYYNLSIPERRVSFKTFWYNSQEEKKGLRKEFQDLQNWPLRGLFWLSKDLYEERTGFKEIIDLDAKDLCDIRNHIEHKYLKLHENLWIKSANTQSYLIDKLAFSMNRYEFEKKTLRLIKLARAALIYLSLAIHCEENRRAKERNPDDIFPGLTLSIWEDDWKR